MYTYLPIKVVGVIFKIFKLKLSLRESIESESVNLVKNLKAASPHLLGPH